MHYTAKAWEDFQDHWAGPQNFRVAPSVFDLSFPFPSADRIVDEMRHDDKAVARTGLKGKALDLQQIPLEDIRKIPLTELMEAPFALSHFSLSAFDAPGKFLHGFGEKVLQPWQDKLRNAGFTWERCYPIIFISGKGCATNYHMDFSHVMAWQIHGEKRFCGLKDPDRWANHHVRHNYHNVKQAKSPDIREEDALCYDIRPGDMLWNVLLTPHWVEAGQEVAISLNISHGGLRHNGRLSPNEQQLEEYRNTHPDIAPQKMKASY